jgi:hypothetical protein
MIDIKVNVKPDHLKAISNSTPIAAISELIWNGFDADADSVKVVLSQNEMNGLHDIRVTDDGDGIPWGQLNEFFGSLGDSWKRKAHRQNGRALHGKNGKGRFKAFSLGELVEWRTTFKDGDTSKTFEVRGSANQISAFVATDPKIAAYGKTGTEVVISNLASSFPSLTKKEALHEITKIFAAYLTEYPGLKLIYNGDLVDPTSVQKSRYDFNLGDILLSNGRRVSVAVTVIDWSVQTDRTYQLCDASGVSLHEIQIGQQIRAPGQNFTVYIKSDYFRELDKLGALTSDLNNDAQDIVRAAKTKVKEHFRLQVLHNRSEVVERWKRENIYPYEDKSEIGTLEKIERQVFDILAVNVEEHLPSFEGQDNASRKFTFRLLAQAVRESPESVQKIIDDVLNLKKEEQEDLAELLKKTTLSKIITSAGTVANRLNFVELLSDLLFQKDSKKRLLERDQLHKTLETEAWIFKEDFYLAGTEKRLEDALAIHLSELGVRADDDLNLPVVREGGEGGRIDLMLSRAIRPTQERYEYLIVELKRPKQRITSQILMQVESYAIAVANDERFQKSNVSWTFLVVSNEMDEHAKLRARQKDRPAGLVFDNEQSNIKVWARTWAEILDDARARLKFFSEQLDYQADSNTELEYLKKAHSKYIPRDIAELATGGQAAEAQ